MWSLKPWTKIRCAVGGVLGWDYVSYVSGRFWKSGWRAGLWTRIAMLETLKTAGMSL